MDDLRIGHTGQDFTQRGRLGRLGAALGLVVTLLAFTHLHVIAQTNEAVQSPSALKKLSLEELFDMEVTSVSKTPEKLSETASAIQVITGEDIRRSGATSIPEALRLASNLQVARKNSHDWAISARGFNTELANKLLVLIDGRTVYTPLFSGVFWDRQDYLLEDIDRIEVISGPGGTLWGANAVNGVINIITKSAKESQGFYMEAGGGSQLEDFTGVRYGGTLTSNVYYRVYGKYFDRGDEVFANGKDATDSWRMGQGGVRIDADLFPKTHMTLQGDYYRNDENLITGGDARSSGGNVLGRWHHTFSEDSDMTLQLYYDQTHLVLPVPALVINATPFAPDGTFTDDLDTYDLDFQNRFPLGDRHRIVWGLGYRFTHDVIDNAPSLAFFPEDLDQHLFSGFVQDEVMLFENLYFTLGTKVEHNDYTGIEYEPSGRLRWTVVPDHTLWAAVSRAVRMPSRIDRDLSQPAPPFVVILRGDSDFVSETVMAYEMGYRAQFGAKVATSVAAFYNDYEHLRSTSATDVTILPFFFENNLEGETYGFELTGDYRAFDWLRLRAGYNLLKEHIREESGKSDLNNGFNETGDPQQQFQLRSSLDLPQNLELDAGLRWVDRLLLNNAGNQASVPAYFELDVRLGWRPTKNLEFSVVGQNLLNPEHPEYGTPGPNRVEIERSVYGKVTLRY